MVGVCMYVCTVYVIPEGFFRCFFDFMYLFVYLFMFVCLFVYLFIYFSYVQ